MKRFFSIFFALLISVFSSEQDLFEEIKNLYTTYGNNQYMLAEPITQQDHALQAAYLAKTSKAPDEIVLALLLHDIGQLTNASYIGQTTHLHTSHDEEGFEWLKEHGFSEFVCEFARFHTLAKIILCELNPGYYDTLSKASQESYHLQKAKFLQPEYQSLVHQFLSHPRLEEFLFARRCDDGAKIQDKNFSFPDFSSYKYLFIDKLKQTDFDPKTSLKNLFELLDITSN
jgi:predicted HD phosphohydrolase